MQAPVSAVLTDGIPVRESERTDMAQKKKAVPSTRSKSAAAASKLAPKKAVKTKPSGSAVKTTHSAVKSKVSAASKAKTKPAAAKAKPAAKAPAKTAKASKTSAKKVTTVAKKVKPEAKRAVAATAAKTPTRKTVAKAAPKAPAAEPKKPVNQRHGFKSNEYIVYPAHGVGRILGIEEQEIAGMKLELFVITFDKEKLTLRVPTGKLEAVGMRKLSEEPTVKKAMDTLKGRARIKRTMWSRRAQEYVAKINSGDLISIAEVVRDLYRSEAQPEQSYSERQLYEDALDRMARELAAVERLDERTAVQRITDVLSRSAKTRRAAEAEAEAEASEGEETVDEAAA